jgi:iron complex outermembrane recepter protein
MLVLVLGMRAALAGELTRRFDLSAQSLASALLEFGHQADTQVLYGYDSSENVDAIRTGSVVGEFTVREALTRMLDGTGLQFRFTAANKIAVFRPTADQPGVTPASGAFEAVSDLQPIDEVRVTGTRLRGALDVISPAVLIPKEELRRSTFATVQDVLYTLPLSSLAGPREDWGTSGNTGYGAGVNLRHLGAGATLVLVNGQRQPVSGENGSFTDVSNIPWSAVERIEIVPDGSSAIYGSDAIAGVVNIIMRDDLEGAETQARFTGVGAGADELQVSQQFGKRWDSGHAFVAYQYAERRALAAADRFYAASGDKRPLGGTDHRTSYSPLGNIVDPMTLEPVLGIPATGVTTADDYSPDINLASRYEQLDILPEREAHNLFVAATQTLGARWSISANARYGVRSVVKPHLPSQAVLVVPRTNPFFVDPNPDQSSPNALVAHSFLRDLGGPGTFISTTRVATGAVSATASLGDSWQLSLEQNYGEEQLRASVINVPNLTALLTALGETDPVKAFNPFGPTNPEVLRGIRRSIPESTLSGIATTSVVADGRVGSLPSGPVKLAIGTEYRRETFDYLRLWGATAETQRHVSSAFAELAVPLIGNPRDERLAPRLELSAAGRFESYSDFGDTFNPRFGVKWAPIEAMKLRASWGRSFRAPTLVDRDTSGNVSGVLSLLDPKAPSGRSVAVAVQGNNPAVREETARTRTAGIDFVPLSVPGLSVSLTYFDVKYSDRIVSPGEDDPFNILLREDQWSSIIYRHPSREQMDAVCQSPDFFGPVPCEMAQPSIFIDYRKMNLAETTMRALEADLSRNWDSDIGSLGVRLMGSYILEFKQRSSPAARSVSVLNTVLNPSSLKLRALGEWSQHYRGASGFSAAVSVSFARSYRDVDGAAPRRIRAWATADVQLGYRTSTASNWFANTDVILNAVNVLNAAPPFVDREDGYDIANAQPIGRAISLEVRKNW